MPNPMIGAQRLPQAPKPPAGPGAMPPLPAIPLTGVPKVGMPVPAPFAAPALEHPPSPIPAILVTPPVLPPLPPTPLTGAPKVGAPGGQPLSAPALPYKPSWMAARNPSANIVQQQYVDLRLEELGADCQPGMKDALQVLESLLNSQPQYAKYKKIPSKEVKRVYQQVERNLQSADLTINFQAHRWFMGENDDPTYTQMYERAVVNDKMLLQNTDQNSAVDRATVDNRITFPSAWQQAQKPVGRGLSPGPQGAGRIMAQMDTGSLVRSSAKPGIWEASNPHFNPHAKQIFIGLNYGRRPHGSAVNWGYSYFVLKSSLKPRCLFYAGDTFNQLGTSNHAGDLQAPYENLGILLGKTQADKNDTSGLRNAIFEGCYQGKILRDSGYMGSLVEAHHFGELVFHDHVEYMVISPSGSNHSEWAKIAGNARKFAQKHGFKVYQMD